MGLDQYLFATKQPVPEGEERFDVDREDIHYWRKHSDLNGYMLDLWDSKGEDRAEFNCAFMELTPSDLVTLIKKLEDPKFEFAHASGFFWGASDHSDEERAEDLAAFRKALQMQDEGWYIYYYPNW